MNVRFKMSRLIVPAGALAFALWVVAGGLGRGSDSSRPGAPGDARFIFDPGADSGVDSRLSAGGEILVRPTLNDREVGWFLLDPAAEGMRLAPSLAEELELSSSGTHRLVSTSKAEERRAWLCPVFRLGPCRAEGLEMTEMISAAEEEADEPIVGVVGTALFKAAVVEIDLGVGAVRLFEPSAYDDARTTWQEFRVLNSLPVVRCRFEGDREGEFGLDMRSPLGIVFFKPAVEGLGLVKNKVTRPGTISGANFGQASVRTRVMAWFEAAGFLREKMMAVFVMDDISLAAAKELTGLIGRDLLKDGLLVLDFGRSRLAVQAKTTLLREES